MCTQSFLYCIGWLEVSKLWHLTNNLKVVNNAGILCALCNSVYQLLICFSCVQVFSFSPDRIHDSVAFLCSDILVSVGLKGQSNRRLITLEEVKQHKTGDCIWTVLKGRVYNIGPYMKYHPGGNL